MADNVNHPSHYADKGIEVIDYIRDTLTSEEYSGYCMGNVLKYVSRWRKKGGVEDLRKAAVYLQWLIDAANSEEPLPVQPEEEAAVHGYYRPKDIVMKTR